MGEGVEDTRLAQGRAWVSSAGSVKHMLTCVSGQLGSAVLNAIIDYDLIPLSNLLISTSSDPKDQKWAPLKERGVTVRYGNYDDVASMEKTFAGVHKLLLISSSQVELDMPEKEHGEGRQRQHWNVLVACKAAGVRHIYYTSLALNPVDPFTSMAATMRAHYQTELTLRLLIDTAYTIIREAPYAECWPLYLGFYMPREQRHEILVAGDGPVSWTAIKDLGLGTALILADACSVWTGVTVTLSSQLRVPLCCIAEMVSRARKNNTTIRVVSEDEYTRHYAPGKGEKEARWWASTYAALARDEAWHPDAPTLRRLLQAVGRELVHVETIVREMLHDSS